MLAAGFLAVGSHEAVAFLWPRVAEVVILFPTVEEIVIVNRAKLVFPGFAHVFVDEGLEGRSVAGTESGFSGDEFRDDRASRHPRRHERVPVKADAVARHMRVCSDEAPVAGNGLALDEKGPRPGAKRR